ncbi:MAG TPA: alpha/beta fold hydrolase [Terriglobales bacterium]|nr:alpha/beta fold hydrolase [Terriglobales bacterium]
MLDDQSGEDTFSPRRWLRGGHRQTLAAALLPRRNLLPAAEKRLFEVEPGAQVLTWCNWQSDRQSKLTVVIIHGLEGSSESQYVIGTANKAWAAGMSVVRMNVRNCGSSETLSPTLYHSGLSQDVGVVVRELISADQLPRIALAGFSMGGNMALKLAGQWGSDGPRELVAVAAVCPGMDLAAAADALHLWRNRIYEWNFLHYLERSVRRKARLFPERYDVACLRGVRSVRDFDDAVTAPHWGFTGADDYYARASASPVIERIAVPTLVIHAQDDPFVPITPSTRGRLLANGNVRLMETRHGGHCGFLAEPHGYDGRWAERQIVEFLERY